MVHFPVLRTRRLTVQLRELSIGESVSIAAMPPHMAEATCSAFLRCAVESSQGGESLVNWTVQERMLAVCHYLASTAEDGPDFSVGGQGHYSDYLDGSADIESPFRPVELGDVGGDVWCIDHLTGAMAESIERMQGEVARVEGRLHWLLGGMAAQLVRRGEDVPHATSGGAFDEYLVKRMRVISGFAESDFLHLMSLYLAGRQKLHHLFRVEFSDDGVVAMPKVKGGAASELPPAKFPVHTCLSGLAHELVNKADRPGHKSDAVFQHPA